MRDFLKKLHYHQSTEFTCGPAALVMAQNMFDEAYLPSQRDELQIWREANTIFMGADHPGCGPHGLAIAATNRGLKAEVWTINAENLFSEWTRTPEHRRAMLMMTAYDKERAMSGGILCRDAWSNSEFFERIAGDEVAIVLIAEGIEAHWMLAAGVEDNKILLVDPYPSETYGMQKIISWNMAEFDDMTKYGGRNGRAAIFLKKEQ